MARYAAVYAAIIAEVRTGDVSPTYKPPDTEWVDITDDAVAKTTNDFDLIGAGYVDGKVVRKTPPRSFNPEFDQGPTMAEILGTTPTP
jgi:hypothetical protein